MVSNESHVLTQDQYEQIMRTLSDLAARTGAKQAMEAMDQVQEQIRPFPAKEMMVMFTSYYIRTMIIACYFQLTRTEMNHMAFAKIEEIIAEKVTMDLDSMVAQCMDQLFKDMPVKKGIIL